MVIILQSAQAQESNPYQMRFDPSTIGKNATLIIDIPTLGVKIPTSGYFLLDLPTGMVEAEITKPICTYDQGNNRAVPFTTSKENSYGTWKLRLAPLLSMDASNYVIISCKSLTVPESIRTPSSYTLKVIIGGQYMDITLSMHGSVPRSDDEIAMKTIYAHQYLNPQRKGSLTALYSTMDTDLSAGCQFRFSYPESSVFANGV